MEKTKVIVDTCFLHKLSSEGKAVENLKMVLAELEYIPVVHPYIYEQMECCLVGQTKFQSGIRNTYDKTIWFDRFARRFTAKNP